MGDNIGMTKTLFILLEVRDQCKECKKKCKGHETNSIKFTGDDGNDGGDGKIKKLVTKYYHNKCLNTFILYSSILHSQWHWWNKANFVNQREVVGKKNYRNEERTVSCPKISQSRLNTYPKSVHLIATSVNSRDSILVVLFLNV